MINWFIFVALSIVAYTLISIFADVTASDTDGALQALKNVFTPLGLLLVLIANAIYGVAIYYGFTSTKLAIPIALAIGALTAWFYSLIFLGKVFELNDALGLVLVIVGIFLLN